MTLFHDSSINLCTTSEQLHKEFFNILHCRNVAIKSNQKKLLSASGRFASSFFPAVYESYSSCYVSCEKKIRKTKMQLFCNSICLHVLFFVLFFAAKNTLFLLFFFSRKVFFCNLTYRYNSRLIAQGTYQTHNDCTYKSHKCWPNYSQ